MDKKRIPKTFGWYSQNFPDELLGKTFELPGLETTYRFDSLERRKGDNHLIVEGRSFYHWAGGTSDPEKIDLTLAHKECPGMLEAIELIEGVNGRRMINPAAVRIQNNYFP